MADLSTEIMIKALDALVLRSSAVAENVANIGSPGYRPGRVPFETALAAAAAKGPNGLRAFTPTIVREEVGGPGVRLGTELLATTAATGRYGAVTGILQRHFELHSMAASRSR